MGEIHRTVSATLAILLLILMSSCAERKNTNRITVGKYYGEVGFYIDSANGHYYGILESSASQVYEGDNSFDCKLLLVEKTGRIDDGKMDFTLYNLIEDTIECGFVSITSVDDSTIKLTISPDKENIDMCGATIDFSSNIILSTNDK